MKLNTEKNQEIITSNNLKSKEIDIKKSPVAIKILTENLYSNVIAALVRELVANAVDACRKANKPLNDFTVHLPSKDDSVFYVEDNGIGMTEDEVMSIYSDLFNSTKSGNNDDVGMYGLGSKVPLAYTNIFYITSSKNGICNNFIETWEDGSLPKINLISSNATDKTGTKVSVIIQPDDINKLIDTLLVQAQYWEGVPTIIGLSDKSYIDNLTEKLKKRNAALKVNELYNPNSNDDSYEKSGLSKVLVMGGVAYNLDKYQFDNDYWISLFNEFSYNFDFITIHANIGDVDILPSREGMQYSKKTKNYIYGWLITNLAKQACVKENLNERLQFYSNIHRLELLNNLWDERNRITDKDIFENYIKFINTYTEDLRNLKNAISDDSRIVKVNCANGNIKSYDNIDISNMSSILASFSKPMRTVIINEKFYKKLPKIDDPYVKSKYIRDGIQDLNNYISYNYFFMLPETKTLLKKIGYSFSNEINSFGNTLKKAEAFINKKNFTAYKHDTYLGQFSIKEAQDYIKEHNPNVYLISELRGGLHAFTDGLTLDDSVFISYKDSVLLKTINDKNSFVLVASHNTLKKAFPHFKDYKIQNLVEILRKRLTKFINDCKNLPVDDSIEVFETFNNFPNEIEYFKSFTWPENSNIYKIYKNFETKKQDTFTLNDALLDFDSKDNYSGIYSRIGSKYPTDPLFKELENLRKKIKVSENLKLLKGYPLIETDSIGCFSIKYGFLLYPDDEGSDRKLKALIDYFALVDGATKNLNQY